MPLHPRAVAHLRQCDPRMADVLSRVGPFRLKLQACSPFESLVRAIVFQQLSTKAASTIFGRLATACGAEVAPRALARLDDGALRALGLSGQKLRYLRDLSRCVEEGALDLRTLRELDDEQVIERLTQVKGIGVWTAQMHLIFFLGRPDVLPVADLGIQKAAQQVYGLRQLPDARRLERLAAPWRPFRSVACWYLWRSLDGDAALGE